MTRILHYPGSKWSMADWIISNMPEHKTYLEPFFGSGAVFFNKKRSDIETINDLDSSVVNLFQVVRDNPDELARQISFTPLSREEYYNSYHDRDPDDSDIELARRFLVRCWQAIGAKTSDRTGWRSLISSNGPKTADEWDRLKEWKRETRDVSAEAGARRQEVLWINPIASEFGYQQQTLNF